MNVPNSCFQLSPSLTADCLAFLKTRLSHSTCPFAWDHNGAVLLWTTPLILRNESISLDVNCPSLSLFSISGKPCTDQILSSLEIMFAEAVRTEIDKSSPLELKTFLQLELEHINLQLLITTVILPLKLESLEPVYDDLTWFDTSDIPK